MVQPSDRPPVGRDRDVGRASVLVSHTCPMWGTGIVDVEGRDRSPSAHTGPADTSDFADERSRGYGFEHESPLT